MSAPANLVTIRAGLTLQAPAAASWRRVEAKLGRLDVNSSYRDYNTQLRAYQAYHAYQAGRGPWAPYAIHPDLSWHCKGLAVDSDDAQRYRTTLAEYGWTQTATAVGEWWHLDYLASRDKHVGEVAGGGSKPLPIPPKPDPTPPAPITINGEEMLLITAPDCKPTLIGAGYFYPIAQDNREFIDVAKKLADRQVNFATKREWQVARAIVLQGTTADDE